MTCSGTRQLNSIQAPSSIKVILRRWRENGRHITRLIGRRYLFREFLSHLCCFAISMTGFVSHRELRVPPKDRYFSQTNISSWVPHSRAGSPEGRGEGGSAETKAARPQARQARGSHRPPTRRRRSHGGPGARRPLLFGCQGERDHVQNL